MSNIQKRNSFDPNRDERRTDHTIRTYRNDGQIRETAVDVNTGVALAKVDALSAATGSAMGAIVRVAQMQRHLEALAPEASGRLNYLADSHALALSDLMTDLRRDLRRC